MGDTLLLIPAFDEATSLPEVLRRVERAASDVPVVVVDDGSQDDTARVARAHGARVLRHPYNLGYGAALQTGYKYALRRGFRFLVQMDADGQHDPAQIPRLLEPLRAGDCDLVIGSRFLERSGYRMSFPMRAGREFFRLLARLLGVDVTDPTSGFQAMNREVLALYVGDFFPSDFPDVDVLLMARRRGARVREIPVHMSEGARRSRIHGGIRILYYPYKMLLSLWAASARTSASGGRAPEERYDERTVD
jgi:glycosyltransferase involved in cell wall biosynthesis